MTRLYKGLPFISWNPKENNKIKIEKIFFPFGQFFPLYLKTYLFEEQKTSLDKYNKSVIEELKNHGELEVKDDLVFIRHTGRYLGKIREVARFILDNNLISIDVVSTGCHLTQTKLTPCEKAIIGFNHLTRTWLAMIDGEVIRASIGDEIFLVRENLTIKLSTSLDARKIIEIFAIGKINSIKINGKVGRVHD